MCQPYTHLAVTNLLYNKNDYLVSPLLEIDESNNLKTIGDNLSAEEFHDDNVDLVESEIRFLDVNDINSEAN